MKKFTNLLFLSFLLLSLSGSIVFAQSIKGRVVDPSGASLAGANVALKGTSQGALADANGNYEISKVKDGTYTVVVSFIGYKTTQQDVTISGGNSATLDFTLEDDFLSLDAVVVTGSFNPQSKLESTVSITTLDSKMIEQQAPRSTGDLIDAIPGFYVESNLGETANNIYPRGLPIGTGGLRYTALREEGLNSFEVSDKVFFNADGFNKVDLTIDRVEGLRGGNAVIFSSNTPGGIINFVSKTGGADLRGDVKYTYGSQRLYRADFNVGGPLTEDKKWRFNVGGFYRYDKGLRDFNGPAAVGGQIKANFTRLFDNDKGYIRFFLKSLNDRIPFWTPVAYQGFDKPRQMPGGPDLTKGTFVPSINGEISIPDPINTTVGNPQFRRIDAGNNAIQYNSIGMELALDLGDGWQLKNQTRWVTMNGQASSTQVIANPTGGGNLLANIFAIGGPAAFTPRVYYTNPSVVNGSNFYPVASQTGENIPINTLGATTNANAGINGYFNSIGITPNALGLNTNAGALNGNGMLLPLGFFVVSGTNTNLINNLQFSKQAGNHSLTFGAYVSAYNSNEYWSFNTLLTEVSSNPRLVDIQFVSNTGGANFDLTRNGVLQANFQYEQSNTKNITFAGFIGDEWKVTDQLTATLGFRYEVNQANGALQNTGRRDGRAAGVLRAGSPITVGIGGTGGMDGNPLTLHDSNSDIPLPTFTNYRNTYEVWGANIGFNFKINENSAAFLNASRGTRYATSQNFLANKDQGILVNGTFQPVSLRNPIEEINQYEAGYRIGSKTLGIAAAVFFTQLKDAPFTFQSADASGNIKLDVLLYDVQNLGAELEIIYAPIKALRFSSTLSLQNPIYTKYPDVVVTEADVTDRVDAATPTRTLNFTDNKVEWIPPFQADLTADYTIGKFNIYINGRYVGKRQANRRNTYELPGFAEFGAGASYRLNKFVFAVQGSNIFNTQGITQGNNRTQDNFGPNAVRNNDIINTGFFILPAAVNFSVQYSF